MNNKPCHSYLFFSIAREARMLEANVQEAYKAEFLAALQQNGVDVGGYSLVGLKPGIDFMLHVRAKDAAHIETFTRKLLHTAFGRHLSIINSLLGLRRQTEYRSHKPGEEEPPFVDGAMRYLIVYPFTKTTTWHLMPFDERREIMKDHVMTAKEHSAEITQLLLYSYGIDDQEFIVSYQADDLEKFQSLVMDLRHTEGRRYTESDTPIYTCLYKPLETLIAEL